MNKKGFTLIELLIVVAIVAILAAVVLVAVNPGRQLAQSRNAERSAEVNVLLNAITQYQLDHPENKVPDCIATTTPMTVGPGADCELEELVPTYVAGIPLPPVSDEFYRAWVTTTTLPYRVNVDAPGAELDVTISVTR